MHYIGVRYFSRGKHSRDVLFVYTKVALGHIRKSPSGILESLPGSAGID